MWWKKCRVGGCDCITQRCDEYEGKNINNQSNIICASNETDGTCYCVSQKCEDKENWCYCISKKEETEHKCEGGSCTCKKEEQKQEEPKKKSLWEKIKDIFD